MSKNFLTPLNGIAVSGIRHAVERRDVKTEIKLPNTRGQVTVPLAVEDGRLVVRERGGGILTGASEIPAGEFAVIICDTGAEVRAAISLAIGMGAVDASLGILRDGEGVGLARLTADRPHGLMGRRVTVKGAAFHIVDLRSIQHRPAPPVLTVEMTGSEVFRSIMLGEGAQVGNPISRARAIAQICREAMVGDHALTSLQDELERMSGARITLASISVQDVLEEIEDALGDMTEDVAMPKAAVVRGKIMEHVRKLDFDVSDVSCRVAMDLMEDNALRMV